MGLTEHVSHLHQATAWRGDIPIESLYTAGIAGERFFREIKDNARLMGTRCDECDTTHMPPRIYCPLCFEKLEEWVEVPNSGRVHTFTILHLAPDGSPLSEPEILAFVQIDGTDGGLVHRLGQLSPDEAEIGLRVEAVFKPKRKREGSILDIECFKPGGDGP